MASKDLKDSLNTSSRWILSSRHGSELTAVKGTDKVFNCEQSSMTEASPWRVILAAVCKVHQENPHPLDSP